jgi:hypothetical protein
VLCCRCQYQQRKKNNCSLEEAEVAPLTLSTQALSSRQTNTQHVAHKTQLCSVLYHALAETKESPR